MYCGVLCSKDFDMESLLSCDVKAKLSPLSTIIESS
jgi:hypothetical protein